MPSSGTINRISPSGPLRGQVAAPPSKSAANRALLLAALARGESRLHGRLEAEDTVIMVRALRQLGFTVDRSEDRAQLTVRGGAGAIEAPRAELFLGNAGTAMRFLAAAVALGSGEYRLDGDPAMRRRPLGDLASALTALGARVTFSGEEGHPPVAIRGGPLAGGTATLRADRSSQFTSALLMVAPCTARGIDLRLTGRAVSGPYVDLTLEMMDRFGGPPVIRERGRLHVAGGAGYQAADVTIEGDASAAAALFAAAAITGGSVQVTGLPAASHQPDQRFPDLLEEMGCRVAREPGAVRVEDGPRRGIRADLGDCPDLAPSLAAVALFAEGPTRVQGAAHLRLKESDRIGDLAEGLRRLGAQVDEHADGFTVHPRRLAGARLDPHGDHRLAMAFAAIGLRIPGVEIEDPACVSKSFPAFFEALDSLRPA